MKNLFFVTVAMFALLSCTGNQRYSIRLEAGSSEYDGYQLSLYPRNADPTTPPIDSATLENGQCVLKGSLDSSDWYVLVYYDPDRTTTISELIYLDGHLTVKVEGNHLVVSGSAVNDAWQSYMDAYEKMSAPVVALSQQFRSDPTNKNLENQLDAAYQAFEAAFRTMALKAIEANLSNPAGVQILKSSGAMLEDADIEQLLSKADSSFLKDPFVSGLVDHVARGKRVAIGQPFVDVALFTPEGDTVTLSQYVGKGRYVLIDFWASWCGPCLRELPNVIKAYNKYHKKGFDIVGISLDESGDDWKAAIKQYGLEWPQMSDLAGWKSVAAGLYAVNSIPHTVLVDPNGIIVLKNLRGEALQAALAERLK